MEPHRCPTPPVAGAGPSPKSPSSSPRNGPTVERERSTSPLVERAPSPEPNCAICLGKLENKSFTDSCLHQFCFNCLLEWSKVKPQCPLCKQSFKSIIHNVRSNEDYDQYHLRPAARNQYTWMDMMNALQQRYQYRSTLTSDHRLGRVLEQDLQRRLEPGDILPTQRRVWHHRRGRRLAPNEFRMNVYAHNMWVILPSVGQPRDVSPENYSNHPEEVHRLIPWLNRELQAILLGPGLTARVLDIVITQLSRCHMQSAEFRSHLESYLRNHYDHFIHEFYTFARSSYDMFGFDQNASYYERNNYEVEVVHEISSDSSDSDVMIMPVGNSHSSSTSDRRRTFAASPGPSSPVAGPSRSVLPVDQASDSDVNNVNSSYSDTSLPTGQQLFTISSELAAQPSQSSEGDGSDGCVFVGYVKPRHERTPEIVTLSSDPEVEEGEVMELPQMTSIGSCNRTYNYTFSTSASSPESSGSEYNPFPVRKSQKKKVQRKGKSGHVAKSGNAAESGNASKSGSAAKSKAKTSHKGGKTTAKSTKKQVHRKPQYFSSDSDSSACSCISKNSKPRRKARSSSTCSSSSSGSCSSVSSSSSSNPTYASRSSRSSRARCKTRRSPRRNKKESWCININMPGVKQEHDYSGTSYEPPYTSSEVNSFLSKSSSNRRPKLRSIVITRAVNGDAKYRVSSGGSSHDRLQETVTKKSQSLRQDGALKKAKDDFSTGPSASGSSHLHHKGGSHSPDSSHRYEASSRHSSKSDGNARRKHSKKDEKKKTKKKRHKSRKDSESSMERKYGLKSKKRKRMSFISDSSDD